jgi:nucleotide-binding universal stress UspA family protein
MPGQQDTAVEPRQILVPFDGSRAAHQALEQALAVAQHAQARLALLYVIGIPPWAGISAYVMALLTHRARQAMVAPLQRVKAAGLDGTGVCVHGVPWQQIIEVAHTTQADLIVMGSHERTGWSRLRFRSVAKQVRRHAPCRVLITHVPGEHGHPCGPRPNAPQALDKVCQRGETVPCAGL